MRGDPRGIIEGFSAKMGRIDRRTAGFGNCKPTQRTRICRFHAEIGGIELSSAIQLEGLGRAFSRARTSTIARS